MVGLFLTTILLVGPSWCSHLCYIGALDNWLAQGTRKKTFHPSPLLKNLRYLTLFAAIITPIVLIKSSAGIEITTSILVTFILISLAMFILSWKHKLAAHCSFFCPISLIVNFLSKINPFRLGISSNCDCCQKCQQICKYCAISSHNNSIRLSLFRKINVNYDAFYIMTITFHSIFIAVARI